MTSHARASPVQRMHRQRVVSGFRESRDGSGQITTARFRPRTPKLRRRRPMPPQPMPMLLRRRNPRMRQRPILPQQRRRRRQCPGHGRSRWMLPMRTCHRFQSRRPMRPRRRCHRFLFPMPMRTCHRFQSRRPMRPLPRCRRFLSPMPMPTRYRMLLPRQCSSVATDDAGPACQAAFARRCPARRSGLPQRPAAR